MRAALALAVAAAAVSVVSTFPILPGVPKQQRGIHAAQLCAARSGDDSPSASKAIEEYQKRLSEALVRSHEERIKAVEALRQELQSAYGNQIAELRQELAAAAQGERRAVPLLAVNGASDGVAAAATPPAAANSAYAVRLTRPGWEQRWGHEETGRLSTAAAAASTAPLSTPSGAASAEPEASPTYAERLQRPGWQQRWGSEELSRTSVSAAAAPVVESSKPTADLSYSARLKRPGWEQRWGAEEPQRVAAAAVSPSAAHNTADFAAADTNHAYAARLKRLGWEARWGKEEPLRVSQAGTAPGLLEAANNSPLPGATDLEVRLAAYQEFTAGYLVRSHEEKAKLHEAISALESRLATSESQLVKVRESYMSYMAKSLADRLARE